MSTIPNSPVFNKILAQNAKAKTDAGISEKSNFSMAHPQKLSEEGLTDLLGTFDLATPTKETNGVVRGKTLDDGGSYFMTSGVIKFKPGKAHDPYSPPPTSYDNPTSQDSGSMNTYLA